jgi:hypothetical protein
MKIRGKRILIKKPVSPESAVVLTDEVKAAFEREMFQKYSRLKVTAVGEEVNGISPDDEVYVGSALANCEVVDINGELYFIVYESNVAIVW